MKLVNGSALVAVLIVAGLAFAPATVMAEGPADAGQADEASAQELETLNRARIERAQAEAARMAAEAVMSATKLDLDIRLIGPTSVAGDL
jgi:ribosomal protein L16/L10AE